MIPKLKSAAVHIGVALAVMAPVSIASVVIAPQASAHVPYAGNMLCKPGHVAVVRTPAIHRPRVVIHRGHEVTRWRKVGHKHVLTCVKPWRP